MTADQVVVVLVLIVLGIAVYAGVCVALDAPEPGDSPGADINWPADVRAFLDEADQEDRA